MQISLLLGYTAMYAWPIEKRRAVFSLPGDLWLGVSLGVARQRHVRANVCHHILRLSGKFRCS